MTDARFPERWLNDRRRLRLSDAAFRLMMNALAWSVANRTDGVIHLEDLELIPNAEPWYANELVTAGLWNRSGDRWVMGEFEDTQLTARELEVLDNLRVTDRMKKRRQRAHKNGDHSLCRPDTCARVPGTFPGTGEDRTETGQDRTTEVQETSASVTTAAIASEKNASNSDDDQQTLCPECGWPLDGTMHGRICGRNAA
jgi:hypothetical protein